MNSSDLSDPNTSTEALLSPGNTNLERTLSMSNSKPVITASEVAALLVVHRITGLPAPEIWEPACLQDWPQVAFLIDKKFSP